jgi:Leucine-rich repeat (LRR) protein
MASLGIAQDGLRELTSDVSRLVNLKKLTLHDNDMVEYIPESISCLQKLQHLRVQTSPLTNLPAGLATLANLVSLRISTTIFGEGLQLPPSLQVSTRHIVVG